MLVGINDCYIYKEVPFSISWISAFISAINKTTHTVCPRAVFQLFFSPNIVRGILIFLFNKSKTLCEKWLWQSASPGGQVLLQNLPGFLSGELSRHCCLPGTQLPTWKDSPFPYAIPGNFRWGGLQHFRLFPSGSLLAVQHFELTSVLRFSSLLPKNPYYQSILDYWKPVLWRSVLPQKALLHKYLMLRKNAPFIRAQKEELQRHFIMYFLICLDESLSYYGV